MGKGYIIALSTVFALAVSQARAQDISRCEYWIDSDYGSRVEQVSPAADISLSVPLDGHSPGLHFFNFRAVNSKGEVGNLMRTLFYLPEKQEGAADVTFYETWIDDDYENHVRTKSDGEPSLSVDVDGLCAGLHFFNFRAVNSKGEVGNLMRTMFYMPEEDVPDVAGYEYWLDDDEENSTLVDGGGSNVCFEIDVSALPYGDHTFSFRAKNSFGEWGPVYSETFTLSESTDIGELETEVGDEVFDVYNIAGIAVLKRATIKDLRRLPSSIYIVNGRKVIVRNR